MVTGYKNKNRKTIRFTLPPGSWPRPGIAEHNLSRGSVPMPPDNEHIYLFFLYNNCTSVTWPQVATSWQLVSIDYMYAYICTYLGGNFITICHSWTKRGELVFMAQLNGTSNKTLSAQHGRFFSFCCSLFNYLWEL